MKTYDYLNGTDTYLYQKKGMFRINTDTTLLGQFYNLKDNQKILDIGTNNGALLLYKKDIKANFYAIDILEEAVELAKENFENNNMQVDVSCIRLQDYQESLFDVIICNPPYFNNSLLNQNQIKHQRHDIALSLDDLFANVLRLLKSNGSFYIVHRASMLNEIYYYSNKYHMRPKIMQFLYDDNKDSARSVVIQFVVNKQIECKVLKPIILSR